jgi:hypothetical protein
MDTGGIVEKMVKMVEMVEMLVVKMILEMVEMVKMMVEEVIRDGEDDCEEDGDGGEYGTDDDGEQRR